MQCVGYVTGRGVKFSRDRNLEDMMDDGIGMVIKLKLFLCDDNMARKWNLIARLRLSKFGWALWRF